MEASKILYGNALLILIVTAFSIFLADGIQQYSPQSIPGDYNASLFRITNQSQALIDKINQTDSALKVKANSNALDFIGFFFSAGYQALQAAVEGVKLNYIIVNEGVNAIAGGIEFGGIMKAVGLLMILIAILLGIIMTIIFKWQT